MRIKMVAPFQESDVVENIVLVYQQVFGNEPWNEGYKCPVCESVLALRYTAKYCSVCKSQGKTILMTEYWPSSRVVSDFYREMQKSEAQCLAAYEADKLIGFAWGYKMTSELETSVHLEAPNLHELICGDFFYLDEVAVLPEQQGAGIGRKLVTGLFQNQPQETILLRTLNGSQMFYLTTRMGGKAVLPISRERVIMRLTP